MSGSANQQKSLNSNVQYDMRSSAMVQAQLPLSPHICTPSPSFDRMCLDQHQSEALLAAQIDAIAMTSASAAAAISLQSGGYGFQIQCRIELCKMLLCRPPMRFYPFFPIGDSTFPSSARSLPMPPSIPFKPTRSPCSLSILSLSSLISSFEYLLLARIAGPLKNATNGTKARRAAKQPKMKIAQRGVRSSYIYL